MKKVLGGVVVLAALGALYMNMQKDTSDDMVDSGKVLKYAFQGDIQGVDPHAVYETFQIGTMGNVYEPLVDRDHTLKLVPALATSWKAISDTEWEFKLRKGVKFHNGNDFNAHDVKFNFERALQTDFAATSKKVKQVKIVDDHTVILVTEKKNPLLAGDLSGFHMMDKEWTTENKADNPQEKMDNLYTVNNANGTGPFKVESYQAGVKTVFVRNQSYWKEIDTNIDKVIFQPIGQDATRVASLLSGAVDLAYPIPLQDHKRLNDNDKVDVLAGPETRNIFIGFDQWRDELKGSDVKGKNPFKDIRVRQAFVHAVDLDLINKKIMRGSAVPSGTLVAEAINGYNAEIAKPYGYDLEKAKKLIAEAGYPNGFKVIMDCPKNRYVNDEKICQAVVSMLGKINVNVELNAQPKAQYFGKVLAANGFDTSFYLLGWAPSSLDALNPLDSLIRCRDTDAGQGQYNLGNYCNPKIGKLTDQAAVELDQTKRNALMDEAYKILKADYGYMPVHDQALSWGASKKLDVKQRADNVVQFVNIKIK